MAGEHGQIIHSTHEVHENLLFESLGNLDFNRHVRPFRIFIVDIGED